MNRIQQIWNRYPMAITVGGVILLWIAAIALMKRQNRKQVVDRISKTDPDVMTLSYLGRSDLPRGIRNNNPGNLTKTAIPWANKVVPGADSRFEQFKTYVWGVRAMIKDITNDMTRDGMNTIRKLITAYAPPNENNTAGYINSLATRTGYGADQVLPVTAQVVENLVREILVIENGNPQSKIGQPTWVTPDMFRAAWELANT